MLFSRITFNSHIQDQLANYFFVVASYEMLCGFSESFPEIISARERFPDTPASSMFDPVQVRHQYDTMYTQLVNAGQVPSYGYSGHSIDFRNLCEFIGFCKYL